ncbi:PREDICTED: uncharacterized protein LOC107358863 isoform X2 [Acropora digitifera]|uniref:uncharacterized protein LOC107358863 isoform X1 n=1 Tax=Acropora digitifera TaxID=70779 RepID=UPI00077A1AD5|nr:PREDICTED: uncharacterized protein LOC107358863 isoform X1 [Acropora digitifera]XP_015780921.1 PREDICTED: uncharacterized protein LOC107358863 isoform X2 [Acropora digitifera]
MAQKKEKEDSGVHFEVGGKGLRIKGLKKSAAHAISSAKDQEVRGDENAIRAFHKLQELHQDAGKLQKKADLLKDLKINASNKGFEIIDNEGGGNCMFHALCDQLKYKKHLEISHRELRETLVKYLQEHPKMSDGTELASFLDAHRFPSWAEYLQKMAQDEWGDHRILFAAANWSQCNIRVISSVPSHEVTMSPLHPNSDADVLVLGHVFELHYVSLRRPTSDSPSQVQEEPGDSRDWSLSSLEFSSFELDIEYFAKFYDKATRHWLFADFDRWFSDPGDSRAYVLLGDAGVGKTVIAAALAKRTQADGRLGACYFCRHNDNTRNNPRSLIGTVAYQLCKYNMEYSAKVGGESRVTTILANSSLKFNELFTKLLHEPLGKCNTCSQRKLVIIDALDETNYESREDFLELLKARFPLLPKWLVFFITSRPENTVQFYLKKYNPCIKICAGNGQGDDYYMEHEADIRRFLEKKVNFSELPYSVEDVVAKCNGLFLYAYYISEVLSDRTSFMKGVNLADHFPGDIESFFLTNFKRVYNKLSEADLYVKLFGCLIAAPAPLPFPFISFIIKKEKSNLDVQTIIDAVSQFVMVRSSDNTFSFLHNLIPSWLSSEEKASRKLFIDRAEANEYFKKIILTFLHCALSDQPEGGLSIYRDVRNYLLHVGVRFLCYNYDNRDTMTTVFRCLTSFHFLQMRVNTDRLEIFSVVRDYKRCLQCQSFLHAEKLIVEEICTALENDIHVLVECPHLLPSCLQWTSEATQTKLAVSGDTLMTCESFDWLPYLGTTLSSENSYFTLSPDKKLLAQCNVLTRIVRVYDAGSLEEVFGPVKCEMEIDGLAFSPDGKSLLFGEEGAGLSVERGRVEEIPFSYGEKRVTERSRDCNAHCLARAFCLWAKLELSQNEDCHSEVFLLRKVRCLLKIVEGHAELKGFGLRTRADRNFRLERKGLNDWQQELDARLCLIKHCEDCCRYYEQEPNSTSLIQRIAGVYRWEHFLQTSLVSGLLNSDPLNSDLALGVIILSLMKSSRKLCSFGPEELFHWHGAFSGIVQSSPNGRLIAVGDPLCQAYFNRHIAHTVQVFMNPTETVETELFTDPVHVIENVDAFGFTCSSDFVVYVQEEGRCFEALSLQTGATLSCVSGFSPLFHIPTQQAGFVFSSGSDESIVFLSDFPLSSSVGRYLKMTRFWSFDGALSDVTFTSGGNILCFFTNLMLSVLVRYGDGSFPTNCAPLTYPPNCNVTPLPCIENCALSRQGNSIAISQKACIFLFCDCKFHWPVFKESEDIGCQVSCLMFSHDGTLLLYCVERRDSKAEVCLWNVDQKKLSSCFFSSTLMSINCCCFSPDNSMVILCGELRVEIWEEDLCSYQCLKIFKELTRLYPIYERFHYCSVSSGNKVLACCIMNDVLLYSLSSRGEESFYCRLPPAHLGQIRFCQLFRGTSYLISYGIDGAVFLWDLVEKKAVAYVRVAEREESIKGMSVSSTEDEVVCLTSLGRVITIELHGLSEPRCHLKRRHWMQQKIDIRSLSWISETLEQESLGN